MTDRELLEKAAKAYWGDEIDDVVSIEWSEQDGAILYTHGDNQDHNGADRTYRWNPLEENHDAFELLVKMEFGMSVEGRVTLVHSGSGVFEEQSQDFGGDANEAARRAIVRAAASIGEKMP